MSYLLFFLNIKIHQQSIIYCKIGNCKNYIFNQLNIHVSSPESGMLLSRGFWKSLYVTWNLTVSELPPLSLHSLLFNKFQCSPRARDMRFLSYIHIYTYISCMGHSVSIPLATKFSQTTKNKISVFLYFFSFSIFYYNTHH